MRVVIVGGGIMGCATAYYLSELGVTDITIIEQGHIACGASGKAGGFLARDWCNGSLGELCRFSFALHNTLAELFGKNLVGYRRLDAFGVRYLNKDKSVSGDVSASASSTNKEENEYFNGAFNENKLEEGMRMGNVSSSAQVTPGILTMEMFKKSKAKLIHGKVTGINFSPSDLGKIESLVVETGGKKEMTVLGDEFCFCMGPWSNLLIKFGFPVPKSKGLKVHSIIVKPPKTLHDKLLPIAWFTDHNHTEIYPRMDGTVYVNGSEIGLEELDDVHPDDILIVPGSCEKILSFWNDVTDSKTTDTEVVTEQVCHVPMLMEDAATNKQRGLPILSTLPQTLNGYICTGHSCWGILCGPGSGKIMAQIIYNNKPNAYLDTTEFQI